MSFPNNPTDNQLFESFGRTYRYAAATNSWSSALSEEPAELNVPTIQAYDSESDLPVVGVVPGSKAFITSSNKLMFWTGSGWFQVALINTSPTITSGALASYELDKDGTPTIITLQATDPEGVPITWSHQVTSGNLGGTTVTNNGNVFTITPSTNSADAGTFTLSFIASDGVNVDTSLSIFTLSFIVNISISSTSPTFSMRTGTTSVWTPQSIDLMSSNWGVITNPSGIVGTRYGMVRNSAPTELGPTLILPITPSKNYTLEFWYNISGPNNGWWDNLVNIRGDADTSSYASVLWHTIHLLALGWGGSFVTSGTFSSAYGGVPLNTWTHLAVVVVDGGSSVFKNGTRIIPFNNGGWSSYSSPAVNTTTISFAESLGQFAGISVVEGIKYTGNFTPTLL